MMSIVHDMAEADVGDITPEHASGVTKAQKAEMEEVSCRHRETLLLARLTLGRYHAQEAMQRIFCLLGHPSISSLRIKSLWEEYEGRVTPESKFVKDLDLFELAVQGVEYEACESLRFSLLLPPA
jgi:putative hydrolase of HD superfamily